MNQTLKQYREVITHCHELFEKKTRDYGTSWRMLRPISIVDQIYIKASRIRQIQETGTQKIGDSIDSEFVGIVNYGIIALIQGGLTEDTPVDLSIDGATSHYQTQAQHVEDLMMQKNHDYGEAWREMRVSSLTDLILQKLLRVKQIEDNAGKTIVSEFIDANYQDMVNYAVFALIHLNN